MTNRPAKEGHEHILLSGVSAIAYKPIRTFKHGDFLNFVRRTREYVKLTSLENSLSSASVFLQQVLTSLENSLSSAVICWETTLIDKIV